LSVRTSSDCKKLTLQEWTEVFTKIWQRKDNELTHSRFWQQVVTHTSQVGEDIRNRWYDEAIYDLAVSFLWVTCYADRVIKECKLEQNIVGEYLLNEYGNSYVDWIMKKYPDLCPYCGNNPCICPSYKDIVEMRKTEYYENKWKLFHEEAKNKIKNKKINIEEYRIKNLNEFILNFCNIYKGPTFGMNEDEICYHLLEEVGEVSGAIWDLEIAIGPKTFFEFEKWVNNNSKRDWELNKIKKKSNKDVRSKINEIKNKQKDVITCLYRSCMEDVIKELTDVFSWTSTLLYKINLRKNFKNMSQNPNQLHESFVDIWTGKTPKGKSGYGVWDENQQNFTCPKCHEPECEDECWKRSLLTNRIDSIKTG
jgi:hypothetical protein